MINTDYKKEKTDVEIFLPTKSNNSSINDQSINYTPKQKIFYESIMSYFDPKKNNIFKIFGLVGSPGTGKSTSLKQFLNKSEYKTSFKYITIKNNLVQDIKQNFNLNVDSVFTMASFIMKLLKITFKDLLRLNYFLIHNKIECYETVFSMCTFNNDFFLSLWESENNFDCLRAGPQDY